MASPVLKPRRERFMDQRSSNESAALRLIAAERPEEIFPILLEEIVFLGFPRAAVLEVDFDSGEIKTAASSISTPRRSRVSRHRFGPVRIHSSPRW